MKLIFVVWLILLIFIDKLSHLAATAKGVKKFTGTTKMDTHIESQQISPLHGRRENSQKMAAMLHLIPNLAELADQFGAEGILKVDDEIREPYWAGGEWVFYRTTRSPRKRRTTPFPKTTINPNASSPIGSPTSSAATSTSDSNATEYINYVCQHPCPAAFEEYGTVCGQRYNGFKFEMKQFVDACDLMAANCVNPYTSKKEEYYRGEWRLLYRGPCWELTTDFEWAPTQITQIFSRQAFWVSVAEANREKYNPKYTANMDDTTP